MNEPNIPGTLLVAKSPWVRWLMHGIGGGAAVTLGLAAIEACIIFYPSGQRVRGSSSSPALL